ncbi:hypothetical protein LUX57_17015 [Actinomadura madurae]|uniref:CurL C-terminal domain-containing protein n=1 Tax=Actinomadura madurae TaxID=1993 RepID=UPI0020D249C7|nr:ketoacyl-synthetase C-terminal extension domain-containing protein [Actinomadura madurae]MCP9966589.1 hypothetical protein [Actinomadura madurae]
MGDARRRVRRGPGRGRALPGRLRQGQHRASGGGGRIAGLIKSALAVWHGELPPQLHFTTPNRHLTWEGSGLTVLTEPAGRTRVPPSRIAVSSFGFGGANAHVIVGRADEARAAERPGPERPVQALCLSAHTPTALATLARRYRAHIAARPDVELADLCHAANTGRAALGHRAAITARSMTELDGALTALASGEASADVLRGSPPDAVPARRSCSAGRARSTRAWDAGSTSPARCSRRSSTGPRRCCAR